MPENGPEEVGRTGVCPETTSSGRWSATRSRSVLGGRTITVVSFGDAAVAPVRSLLPGYVGRRVDWLPLGAAWNETAGDVLARRLAAARVGWRLVLVGDEAPVLAARAHALGAGVLDEEISCEVLAAPGRSVYCAHCACRHLTAAAVGETSACPGCGAELVVYHHLSRRIGAHLGYRVDAEEAP